MIWLILIAIILFVFYYAYREYERIEKNANDVIDRHRHFIDSHKYLGPEEIILLKEITDWDKTQLLMEIHGYNVVEATHLIKTALKEDQRAKLRAVKRKLVQKISEQYNNVPIDDRQPISDEVKTFVWQRDKGKCVKCGGTEKLEFDHIIPFSKGGSNTERNLQLLCERCNREKSSNI